MQSLRYNIDMQIDSSPNAKNGHNVTALTPLEISNLLDSKDREIIQLRRQVAWFQRQIFGQKSERRLPEPEGEQGILGEAFSAIPAQSEPNKKTAVAGHFRESKQKPLDGADESALFFDAQKVPVQVVAIANPEIDGLDPADYEVIGEKVSHRLAQRPGSYVILKYVRPVIKRLDTQSISCPVAPVSVVDGSRADVSFIAGMIVDKFSYHQPLYRQHTKLTDSGIKVSRAWLTKLMPSAVALLEPIHHAQLDSIRSSRVKAMDETPIKAGRARPGKMKAAYFWPVYGEQDEICFLFYPSLAGKHVQDALGLSSPLGAVLQTDGYAAYAQYAKKTGLTHAQCWAHARRRFMNPRTWSQDPQRRRLIGLVRCIESSRRFASKVWPAQPSRNCVRIRLSQLPHNFLPGSRNSSMSVDSYQAAHFWVRCRISESVAQEWQSTLTIRMYRLTRTTLNALCGLFRWAAKIGYSVGLSWVQNISALSRA